MRPLRSRYVANVAPYFFCLADTGFSGEITSGVPSELNTLLAEGAIDACPSSSFEYGGHAKDYCLLPGHSISSIGPVHSVLLLTTSSLAELAGQDIAITGESATSIHLLKILLLEFCGIDGFTCTVPNRPIEDCMQEGQYEIRLEQDESVWANREERDRMLEALEAWQGGVGPEAEWE